MDLSTSKNTRDVKKKRKKEQLPFAKNTLEFSLHYILVLYMFEDKLKNEVQTPNASVMVFLTTIRFNVGLK